MTFLGKSSDFLRSTQNLKKSSSWFGCLLRKCAKLVQIFVCFSENPNPILPLEQFFRYSIIGGFPCKPAELKLLQKILSKNIFNKYHQRVSSKNASKKSLVASPLFRHLDSKKFRLPGQDTASLKLCWQIFRQFAFNNY